MNLFGIIILTAILLDYFLNLIGEWLNLKAMKTQLPEEASGIYDKEKYKLSQEYQAESARFGLIAETFDVILILGFWYFEGFNWLDDWTRSWEFNSIATGLIYIGSLLLFRQLLMLPFSFYSTFVIEERYGFNKSTLGTFIADLVKGFFLALLLGGPLLGGVLWFFESTGDWGWLFAWGAVTLFILAIQFIAPTWIMPLFNKFIPLENGTLKEAILSYARSVNFPLNNIYVMDGSKRSSKANAFFTGFGNNKRIALFDTLINQHTILELQAVLAHEIGHYKKKHILKNLFFSIFHTGILFFFLSQFLTVHALYDAFYMDHPSIYTGLIFFSLLFSPIELGLSFVINAVSRNYEHEADRFAAETIDDPENMVEALKKLSANNLSNLTPHPFYVFLNDSHPPVLERIKEIRKLQKNAPSPSIAY